MVTSKRRKILIYNITLLRTSFQKAIDNYNFEIIAICILPDHLHMIIEPYDINDYPKIIKQIKTFFSKNLDVTKISDYKLSKSNIVKQERDIWQRRYWEHTMRSEEDLHKHLDYIHYNPIKHGLVENVKDWQYSSFQKFVENGVYDASWCNYGDTNKIAKLDLD